MAAAAPHRSTPGDRCALLVALRLGGAAEVAALVARTGWEPGEIVDALGAAQDDGLVRASRPGEWSILPAGRIEGERLLADQLEHNGTTEVVREAYRDLLHLNADLLQACTDWQLRTVEGAVAINDHSDPAHDAAVIAALDAVHAAVVPALDMLRDVAGFESYAHRLANALARVHAGEVDYLTKPTVDSFHQVWFELHEHLLAALGIERSTEGQAG